MERRIFYDSIYNPVDHISGGGFGNDCCLRSKRHCSDSAVRRCDYICIDCGLDHQIPDQEKKVKAKGLWKHSPLAFLSVSSKWTRNLHTPL